MRTAVSENTRSSLLNSALLIAFVYAKISKCPGEKRKKKKEEVLERSGGRGMWAE